MARSGGIARAARPICLAVAVMALCVGCTDRDGDRHDRAEPTSGAQDTAEKSGSGEQRSDLEPLLSRFTVLGEPSGATWYSGRLGRDDVLGPSTYWIDAVVELPQDELDALVEEHEPLEATSEPDVVADLRGEVPSGALLTDDGLDRAFSTAGFAGQVWLDPGARRVVITSKGQ